MKLLAIARLCGFSGDEHFARTFPCVTGDQAFSRPFVFADMDSALHRELLVPLSQFRAVVTALGLKIKLAEAVGT